MKISRLLLAASLLLTLKTLSGQDIHYSLFNMSPMTLNPALTGAFEGTLRLGGIYRNQWFTATNMGTPSAYVDAPVVRGFRKNDWVGAGLAFFQDQAGLQRLRTTGAQLSAAYHFALNKRGSTMLTLGGQYGTVTRNVTFRDVRSENNGFDPTRNDPDFPTNGVSDNPSAMYTDINAGLMLRTEIDKETSLELGFRLLHIGVRSLNSFARGDTSSTGTAGIRNERPQTMGAHGRLLRQLDEKWSMEPTFFWQSTPGGGNEISLQAWAINHVKPELNLRFGLGYRVSDSGKLLFGLDYKDLRAALAYDLNISSANAITDYQGGFELAAYYIIKIYKKPELKPAILCPRF